MYLLKLINRLRRAVMRNLTRNMGVTRIIRDLDLASEGEIKHVLICRPNHRLGNQLLITPLLHEVADTLPDVKIDLFVKGSVAPVLFKNYAHIERIIMLPKRPLKNVLRYLKGWIAIRRKRYDLVINVVNHSSSGKIAAQFANARYRFLGEIDEGIRINFPDHKHMAKFPVYSFRNYIHKAGSHPVVRPVPEMDLRLSAAERAEGRGVLSEMVKNENPCICLYTYATGAKCYPPEWWDDFYQKLLLRYPEYNIIEVLPMENVSQIDFRAPAFYSKDLRAIGSFISNTAIFIGADSGMMHLASAVHVPTLGLFKAANINTYAPYNGASRGILTDDVSTDELVRIAGTLMVPHRPPALADKK